MFPSQWFHLATSRSKNATDGRSWHFRDQCCFWPFTSWKSSFSRLSSTPIPDSAKGERESWLSAHIPKHRHTCLLQSLFAILGYRKSTSETKMAWVARLITFLTSALWLWLGHTICVAKPIYSMILSKLQSCACKRLQTFQKDVVSHVRISATRTQLSIFEVPQSHGKLEEQSGRPFGAAYCFQLWKKPSFFSCGSFQWNPPRTTERWGPSALWNWFVENWPKVPNDLSRRS